MCLLACLIWLAYRLISPLEQILLRWSRKSASTWDDFFVSLLASCARVVIPVIALILTLPTFNFPSSYDELLGKGSSLLIIGAICWVLFRSVSALEQFVLSKYDISASDNLQARKVHTQIRVLTKTLHVVIGIFTVASGLMVFEQVRRLGGSILASAGVIGIIVGFAAQKTIANLFAGFQLAMTQPIRIDDVVIVEGEWGRVEEITLTYVVIHIWDQRRLVVPLSYFIEKPFQNWTRVSANLLGSVMLWVDYAMPLARLREEVRSIVESSPGWDRRFWNLQVTEATDRAMQIRVLATAQDSGKAWDLRCEIRERLITAIQERYAAHLPKVRADVHTADRQIASASLES
jgi:small-conductance mechanosensitive channel